MRIGVNAGSLEKDLLENTGACPEAMVESALDHARILQDHDSSTSSRSGEASDVFLAVAPTSSRRRLRLSLHIGITEAGALRTGHVEVVSIGRARCCGRESATRPHLAVAEPRRVRVAFELLRHSIFAIAGVNIISCPSFARQQYDVIRTGEALKSASPTSRRDDGIR